MRILDRQRYWSFLKAYLICYVSLVGLFIVIDAFSNFDEFTKRAEGVEVFRVMARYYLVHQSLFFDYLCGVIGMMAAIFTVTWMQRNNEQLAILAAGVSTHRAIRPVLVSSVIVSGFAVANQELIMPRYAEELTKSHDDDGLRTVHVSGRYDSRGIYLHGVDGDRATRTLFPFYATIPVGIFGSIRDMKGQQATYIPMDHPTAPLKGGWLVRGATINPPLEDDMLRDVRDLLRRVDGLGGFPRPYVPPTKADEQPRPDSPGSSTDPPLAPHSEIPYLASLPPLPLCANLALINTYSLLDRKVDLGRGDYFLRSSLTFQAMTRKPDWFKFATTRDLIEGLTDPSTEEGSERRDVSTHLHVRILRPILGLNLLFMSLPLVLGGLGRNAFINLGFALANAAIFYGAIIFCQYLSSFSIVPPTLAAWIPLIFFGTIAPVRWGQIRT
ncbi:MAG TPA: LptF/LptG family permease [Isosphaeraceae bacterium]|nr:LptF/LptG family permease [Isosphaeraceae bacterium]